MVTRKRRGRWSCLPVTAIVVAVALLPVQRPGVRVSVADLLDQCRALQAGDGVRVGCAVLTTGGAEPVPSSAPLVTAVTTDGRPGCLQGPGRPVVATTMPALSMTFAATLRFPPVAGGALEFQALPGSETVSTGGSEDADDPATLTFTPGELAPGGSYRWRVSNTRFEAFEYGWSQWCEFTVAADAPDFRSLDDAEIHTVLELGLRPDRRYPVSLTARQWDTVLETLDQGGGFAVSVTGAEPESSPGEAGQRMGEAAAEVRRQIRDSGRRATVTLTGGRWATVVNALAEWASIRDDIAEEFSEPGVVPDGSAYRAVLDTLSARLGGPSRSILDPDDA